MPSDQLDTLLSEQRRFPPPQSFVAQANGSRALQHAAERDREGFWAEQARALQWIRPWDRVLEWKPPHAKWFVGGQLNVAANCLDRHLDGPRRTRPRSIWEGEPGDRRVLTYRDLHREVGRFANVLKRLGVKKGDRVAIYMPMVPEAAIAMLACARIGAVALGRLRRLLRRGAARPHQRRAGQACSSPPTAATGAARSCRSSRNADEALARHAVDRALHRGAAPAGRGRRAFADMTEGRDHWWHRLLEAESPPTAPPSRWTPRTCCSSSTPRAPPGKPKGIVHTTGGYLTRRRADDASTSSTSRTRTSSGAPPTSAG